MRLVLLHHTAPPVAGGVERVIGYHARLFAAAGHAVTIVAGRGEPVDDEVELERQPLVDSRHPRVLAVSRELAAGRVPASYAELRTEIVEALRPILAQADAVFCHNVCSLNKNLALTAALRMLADEAPPPRFVLWHHDLAWAMAQYRPQLHDGEPWDLLRSAWPGALQVAVSETRRQQLAALTGLDPGEITVVPNGLDLARLLKLEPATVSLLRRSPFDAAEPLLLMTARIVPRKNIELGLATVAALRSMGRPAGLVVTGPSDPHDADASQYMARLAGLRDQLGLADCAWFLNADSDEGLPDAVVADLNALADVLFMPSRDEGFGLPIIEALAHRLPIVCADLPSLRELAGESAVYIQPDADPVEVATRIVALIDGDPRVRLAMDARRRYAWQSVYRRCLAPLLADIEAGAQVGSAGPVGR